MILRQETMPRLERSHGRGVLRIPGTDWMADPLRGCADAASREAFFSDLKADQELAIALCGVCPVVDACDRYATENREAFGIWGGKVRGRPQRTDLPDETPDDELIPAVLTTHTRQFKRLDRRRQALVIQAGLKQGDPIGLLAKKFGVKAQTLLQLGRLHFDPNSLDGKVHALHQAKRSDLDIATALGIHPRTVSRIRQRHGLHAWLGPGGRAGKQAVAS